MRVCSRCATSFPDDVSFCPHDGTRVLPLPDAMAGTTLPGQFQVDGEIGRGAMGVVYRAWQSSMERPVAIKVLHRSMVRDPAIRIRFAREARSVARLSHPNIVTVHVVGETDDGLPFLVMEMVEGQRLDELLAKGRIPAERAVRVIRQVVSALADAHAAGIVHRDLKPANVMLVQRRRARDFVKILDFGIAKFLHPELNHPGESRITRDGAIFGTPHYISPEQAAGSEVDHRADIYSVGVMLYQMASGRLPFEGAHVPVLVAHMSRDVPPVTDHAPELSPVLAGTIMRCLEKRPEQRFQSAEELADALDALDDPRTPAVPWASSVLASSDSGPQVAVDAFGLTVPLSSDTLRVRRPGRRIAAGAAAILLLAAAAVAFARGRQDEPSNDFRPAPAPASASDPDRAGGDQGASALPRRAEIVADRGYSMRVLIPERMIPELEYEITMDVWDPDGSPVATSDMIVILIRPGSFERAYTAKASAGPGHFVFRERFEEAGEYILRVHPPGGEAALQLYIDVSATGAYPQGSPQSIQPRARPRDA